MRIETDHKLDFHDVLIKPKRSTLASRGMVSLERTFFNKPHKPRGLEWSGIPIIAANMDFIGTFTMARALAREKICTALHKHHTAGDLVKFFRANHNIADYVFYSLGINVADLDKFTKVNAKLGTKAPVNICIDIANGYIDLFGDFVKNFRASFPDKRILAGNVVTGEMTEQLLVAGADIVKIGIGPGSVCTTRRVAGVGYPQLSAIIECADAAHGLEGLICGDGGIQSPGDLGKAFGAGADFIMVGGMFAGHDECGGEIVEQRVTAKDGAVAQVKKFMRFHGMSSTAAMHKHAGGVVPHRTSEGKVVLVPYRGTVATTVQEMLGGVRSACTYTGSRTLKELNKRTTFIMVNRQLNTIFGD